MTRLTLAVAAGLAAAGCSPPPAAVVAPTPAAPARSADNPDYANWSRFKPGTTVVRRSVSERQGRKTTSTDTLTLTELTDTQLVVQRQNTTERDDGYKKANPADPRKYSRTFTLPAGMSADDFARPALKAKLTGEEPVAVLGKEYQAKVYKWTEGTEAGPMGVTVWLVDDLPGRVARQVMSVEKLGTTTTEEVVELRVK